MHLNLVQSYTFVELSSLKTMYAESFQFPKTGNFDDDLSKHWESDSWQKAYTCCTTIELDF